MRERTRQILGVAGSLGIAGCIVLLALRDARQVEAVSRDIGPVMLNVTRDFDIRLTNPDSVVRPLRSITPSCTCLKVLSAPESILPGASAMARVRFTPERPGLARADLLLDWDVKGQSIHHIRAEVILPPEALPSPDTLAAARKYLADGTLATAASMVAAGVQGRVIIDVRSREEYQQASIANSIHVRLVDVPTLPASLRGKPGLLVDRGLGSPASLELVGRLRSGGWKDLQVLEGGIAGWQAHGGALSRPPPPSLRLVSAAEARECCTRPGWIMVVPRTLADTWRVKELMPELLVYDSADTPEQVASHVSGQLLQRRPGNGAATSTLHVLLATESGENADALAGLLQAKAAGTPVFVLDGGLRAYLAHLRSLRTGTERQWLTLADYGGVLADLRSRQNVISACASCLK